MILLLALGLTFLYLLSVGGATGIVYPRIHKWNHERVGTRHHLNISRDSWCSRDHYLYSGDRGRKCAECIAKQKFCPQCIWATAGIVVFSPLLLLPLLLLTIPIAGGYKLTNRSDLGWRERKMLRTRERIAELDKELGLDG